MTLIPPVEPLTTRGVTKKSTSAPVKKGPICIVDPEKAEVPVVDELVEGALGVMPDLIRHPETRL
jgi:hypothetical protein